MAQFLEGPAPRFRIRLAPDAIGRLRQDPRTDVPAEVEVDGVPHTRVGIHIKGAAGSSRDVDDRPALTLRFDRFVEDQRCFGLEKLHLNNSVQDETLLSENIASRLYREAGVPTARATHAWVELNGADLGLYVLKEGYDADFIRRNFPEPDAIRGNLYDGGFLRDLDEDLKRDAGRGPDDHSDLARLRRVLQLPPGPRGAQLGRVLDVDRFVSYLALQALTDDWDGYARNRNNYRLYLPPGPGPAVFIPHGMDQLFGDVHTPVFPDWAGLAAAAASDLPEVRLRQEARLRALLEDVFTWERIQAHLRSIGARVAPGFESRSEAERRQWALGVRSMERRIAARIRSVRRQLGMSADPGLPTPSGNRVAVTLPATDWESRVQEGHGVLRRERLEDRDVLLLRAGAAGTVASFRCARSLAPGEYVFEVLARSRGLAGTEEMEGRGAGIRISGTPRQGTLLGDTDWTPMRFEFEVEEESEVVLVIEIRADRGEAAFDLGSLRLRSR